MDLSDYFKKINDFEILIVFPHLHGIPRSDYVIFLSVEGLNIFFQNFLFILAKMHPTHGVSTRRTRFSTIHEFF